MKKCARVVYRLTMSQSQVPDAEVRTAPAADKPCELYADHGSAVPSVTQGHHIYPVYLQNRKYGRIVSGELAYLCGTCHDNVHAWLYFIMGERREPRPTPPPRARRLAQRALDWFNEETPA